VQVAAGALRAFFLYDIADTIDLRRLRTVSGEGLSPAHLRLRPHTSPAYLEFPTPPLTARLSEGSLTQFSVDRRVKLFDYGVLSVRLSIPFSGSWEAFLEFVLQIRNEPQFVQIGLSTMNEVKSEIADALDDPHPPLIEDYYIAEIERFSEPMSAEALVGGYATELASLLLGEAGPFSTTQVAEALRQRFSYFADDLTIVQWDAAVIYDRPESADAIADILEFANSQLVELRTYDALLDRELDNIYASQPGRTIPSLLGRRAAEQAGSLRYIIVDVLELIDRFSNALKIIGDAYYARIYRAATQRLGLEDWERQIDRKLDSIGEIYRFFSDQARSGREQFLEIIVILLIVVEVVIGVLTLHR
jgi:hypothetical protein